MASALRQIISFSVYGDRRLYCEGALRNTELAPIFYPGWTCRFYYDDSVPPDYVRELAARGAELVKVTKPSLGPMYGHYWRMWVAADPQVDRFIVRDADSRLNPREKAAVDEWISSGKSFHLMRDSVHHRSRALGGMWGGIGGKLPNIAALIDGWRQLDQPGGCDRFVAEVLLPLMQDDYICHDGAGYFDDGRPFPPHPPLDGTRFVGEIVEVDGPPVDIWRQSAEFENRLFRTLKQRDDLTAQMAELSERLRQSEAAGAERLQQTETLTERLHQSEAAAAERLQRVETLTERLRQSEAAGAERGQQIDTLTERLRQSDADQVATVRQISILTRQVFDLQREIERMRQSRSWRITQPLRSLNAMSAAWRRRLFGKQHRSA